MSNVAAAAEHSARPQRHHVATSRVCVTCLSPFTLDCGEVRFYVMRGLELPRRCERCRARRRELETAVAAGKASSLRTEGA